jgi:hypothetical protein
MYNLYKNNTSYPALIGTGYRRQRRGNKDILRFYLFFM